MGTVTDAQLRELLSLDRIAVIGCSTASGTAVHETCAYFRERGYDVYRVTSDEPASDADRHDPVGAIDHAVDAINVHQGVAVGEIVDAAIDRGDVSVIWTHLNVRDKEAARRARDAGLIVVQDRDMTVEHRRVFG